MLKRKIEKVLLDWKNEKEHKPLIIKGCRQCGKTYSVLDFAHKNYKNTVYVNFVENEECKKAFEGSLNVDKIVMMLTAMLGEKARFEKENTILVLDEIQLCPSSRTALKFLKSDGRYDVIATSSFLNYGDYVEVEPKSIPVGYESIIEMYPLSYEEFVLNSGITEEMISLLKNNLEKEEIIPEALHYRMKQLLLEYTVVGGFPEAVNDFLENKDINRVTTIQQNIVSSFKDDMERYAPQVYKGKVTECFSSIPKQLCRENKKFQYSIVKKGSRASTYEGCLNWIEDANIIRRCYNLSFPGLPLEGNAQQDIFKVYMCDMGLLVSMLEKGTAKDILQGNLFGYKGAVFENLIADIFSKMGRKLYYYRKDSGLEIDFVIRYKGECTLLDIKQRNGNSKRISTILNNPEKYHVNNAIKFGDHNISRNGNVLMLPLYMAFLITEY